MPPANGDASPGDDTKATGLLNEFLRALQNPDPEQAEQAVLPLVHASLKSPDGRRLTRDLEQFSFKKAQANARFYAVPVQVTRVRPSQVTAIGFGPTAEAGRSVDYFVAKRAGVQGMPAPVTVFFPQTGGPPRIAYMGSL